MQFFTRFATNRGRNLAAKAAFALGAVLAVGETRQASAQPPSEVGVWINHEGKGAVEIKPCGPALCGFIVWLRDPVNDQGQPLFDRYNLDETKRNRPICGLPVIGNVKRTSEGWDEGWIYNPEEGAQYDVAIRAAGDRLTVTGYKGVKLFSKTFTWTRAPADLQRCAGAPASQTKAKPAATPPKVAAPKPTDGSAPAKKQAATGAGGAPAKAAVAGGTATATTKKAPAKAAPANPAAAKAADGKKPVTPDKKAAAAPAAKKPAPTTATETKPVAKKSPAAAAQQPNASVAAVPKPVAAKRPEASAKNGEAIKKAAAKPAAKKQEADEAEASPAAID